MCFYVPRKQVLPVGRYSRVRYLAKRLNAGRFPKLIVHSVLKETRGYDISRVTLVDQHFKMLILEKKLFYFWDTKVPVLPQRRTVLPCQTKIHTNYSFQTIVCNHSQFPKTNQMQGNLHPENRQTLVHVRNKPRYVRGKRLIFLSGVHRVKFVSSDKR